MFVFIIFVAFVSSIFVHGIIPQNCNKLLVSRFYEYSTIGNMSVSANLELIKAGTNASTIIITNVSVEGNLNMGTADYFCINQDYDHPSPDACSQSLNSPFNFTTQKPAFNLVIHFPNDYFFLYFGFADDGAFSYQDGTLFTPDHPTFSEIDTDIGTRDNYTQTCISFFDIPVSPEPSEPKCKTFKSQSSILNSTDNFAIYATSTMNWTLNHDQFGSIGNYSAPGKFFYSYVVNNVDYESCGSYPCSYPLKPGDKKVIIQANLEERVGFDLLVNPIPMIGRIIFRGNQTLMMEGVPYTPSNNCLFYNYPYSDTQVSTNTFCCIEFENS